MEEKEQKENSVLQLSEQDILNRLLAAGDHPAPQQTVIIKRLGIPITLKGLGEEVDRIEKQCTFEIKSKSGTIKERDDELFDLSLLVAATVSPNWNDPSLLSKYKASGPEQVVKKLLLTGERSQLGSIVLDLSGYGEDAIEEIKN
jgi:hypothetical protein